MNKLNILLKKAIFIFVILLAISFIYYGIKRLFQDLTDIAKNGGQVYQHWEFYLLTSTLIAIQILLFVGIYILYYWRKEKFNKKK